MINESTLQRASRYERKRWLRLDRSDLKNVMTDLIQVSYLHFEEFRQAIE